MVEALAKLGNALCVNHTPPQPFVDAALKEAHRWITDFTSGSHAMHMQEICVPCTAVEFAIDWLHKSTGTNLFTLHSCKVQVPSCARSDNCAVHCLPDAGRFYDFRRIIGDRVLFDTITAENWDETWNEIRWDGSGCERTLWILAPHIDSDLYRLFVQLNNKTFNEGTVCELMIRSSGLSLLYMLGSCD